MTHNENSRVKIPAILHLMRMGYGYIPQLQHEKRDERTNIFPELFVESVMRINPGATKEDVERLLQDVQLELDYEDLGEKFYQRLTSKSNLRLIDFDNFEANNSFHVTTEMPCKYEEESFRPDISILINGMPLGLIEVKIPNNQNGIIAEHERINRRFQNKRFRRFANITQLLVFSNNMEYQDGVAEPVFGAFYATSAYGKLRFNYFREDHDYPVKERLALLKEEWENEVLRDNNLMVIKSNPEFLTNKQEDRPTNRILTSLFSKERLKFILQYAFAYVKEESGGKLTIQKHIMRYPQLFATQAIAARLDTGEKKGIIWHTQGSGKTALAYFNVKHLTDYYQRKGIIPKFYFIVDRLDLLNQASTEFANRGLKVHRVNSREEFNREFQKTRAIYNDSGIPEITVVNIQKFNEDLGLVKVADYDIQLQRIYFIDEAHRGYNPRGNFLLNLIQSDKQAVKIALTGTPMLQQVAKDYSSTLLFGDYIHKYYYNMSIADGYTLRLIREDIRGNFKIQMQEVLEQIEIMKGQIRASEAYAHPSFAGPLLDYIVSDLIQFRRTFSDTSLGGMVVCDSSDQARELFRLFEERFGDQETDAATFMAAEPPAKYGKHDEPQLSAALILHDENDKGIRRDLTHAFKKGKIDLLFVYNMLLTGFDAHRLKKLYLARVIHDHNLLQTLTRVNRPYKDYRFGYVVDFADISKAFDRTNQMYFNELQEQLGDEMEAYSNLFKTEEEMLADVEKIKEALFYYDLENLEHFATQISDTSDKDELIKLLKALQAAKELKNTAILQGFEEFRDVLDFARLNRALIEVRNRLNSINLVEQLENRENYRNMLDHAMEDILFEFVKVSEEELKLADEHRDMMRKAREELQINTDPKDPQFVNLFEELERIFKNKNLAEMDQEQVVENMRLLEQIYDEARALNRRNEMMSDKYKRDQKYMRIHKRIQEDRTLNLTELQLYNALMAVKEQIDNQLEKQHNLIQNEAFFMRMALAHVVREFKNNSNIPLDAQMAKNINLLISQEYTRDYNNF